MSGALRRAIPPSLLVRLAAQRRAMIEWDPVSGRVRAPEPPVFSLVGVYRRRNAAHMLALAGQSAEARLWALDESDPSLASVTVGEGPGGRFALLNELLRPIAADRVVVVSDDDVALAPGALPRLVAIAMTAGLDMAQPAHGYPSYHTYPITRRRALSVLRRTNFVEIGPLLVIGPSARGLVTPFPEEGMGWGVDLEWMRLAETEQIRMGIIDAVPARHLAPVGVSYDASEETSRLTGLDETAFWERHRTLATVRPWRWAANLRAPA